MQRWCITLVKQVKGRIGNVISLCGPVDNTIHAYETETLKVAYAMSPTMLCIKQIEVKEPYRRKGSATKLLMDICDLCDKNKLTCSIVVPPETGEYFTDLLEYLGFRFYEKWANNYIFIRNHNK